MIEKVLNTFHDRQNEVDNFIFMIEKFKKENQSNDDFLNLLEQISENNLKTFSDFLAVITESFSMMKIFKRHFLSNFL